MGAFQTAGLVKYLPARAIISVLPVRINLFYLCIRDCFRMSCTRRHLRAGSACFTRHQSRAPILQKQALDRRSKQIIIVYLPIPFFCFTYFLLPLESSRGAGLYGFAQKRKAHIAVNLASRTGRDRSIPYILLNHNCL